MTQNGGGDDSAPKTVPEGVLAGEVLKEEPAAQVPGEEMLAHPSPAILPVDPNYVEPTTLEEFKEMAAKLAREAGESRSTLDAERVRLEQGALIAFLLARVGKLEEALMPYANMAMMMANARMCLAGDGRAGEPAGGTWLSNIQGIQMQANEGIFFNACDAYGRKRIEEHMIKVFNKLQEAAKLQQEKIDHLDAGGRVDH